MKKFKVGDLVTLPNKMYHGMYGRVWEVNEKIVLVRFNGVQQRYFFNDELKPYKDCFFENK